MSGVFHWIHNHTVINHTMPFIWVIVITTVLFFALMAALHQLPQQGKKWLTIIGTFLAGAYFLLEYMLPTKGTTGENILTGTVGPVSLYIQNILIWTILLGIISLVIVHGRKLITRQSGWHNSLALFIAMIAMMIAAFWSQTGNAGPANVVKLYNILFNGLLVNLDAAMFSLLAFYIASAAYRAFRVRTVEASLLMISALIVMLGMVNVGVYLTHTIPLHSGWSFFRFERLSIWILNWINTPAQRAVTIGVTIGALAMAMRIWLSLERGAFFSQEQ